MNVNFLAVAASLRLSRTELAMLKGSIFEATFLSPQAKQQLLLELDGYCMAH